MATLSADAVSAIVRNLAPLELAPREFQELRALARRAAGLNLHEGKEALVRSRLGKRLRALGLPGFGAYLRFLAEDVSGAEVAQLVDLLTTNKTSFFREARHFDFLRTRVLPALRDSRKPIRLWSAGCSTGEEPISLAIEVLESLPATVTRDLRILATDISCRVLARARAGVYEAEALAGVSPERMRRWFQRARGPGAAGLRPREEVRRLVRYARLNLMDPWPMRGSFDVVFCRNVMIYFDRPTQERLVARFWDALAPGGYLFVGHSESMSPLRHRFTYLTPAVYRKDTERAAARASA